MCRSLPLIQIIVVWGGNEYTINNQGIQHLNEMNGIKVQTDAVFFWVGANKAYICGSLHTLQSGTIA